MMSSLQYSPVPSPNSRYGGYSEPGTYRRSSTPHSTSSTSNINNVWNHSEATSNAYTDARQYDQRRYESNSYSPHYQQETYLNYHPNISTAQTYAPSYVDRRSYEDNRSYDRSRHTQNTVNDYSYTDASYTDASQRQLIQYFIQNNQYNYPPSHVYAQPRHEDNSNQLQMVYMLLMLLLTQRGVDKNTAHATATATAIAHCDCPSQKPEARPKHPALPTSAVGSVYGDPYVSIGVLSRNPEDGFSAKPVGRTVLLKDVSDRLGVVGNFVEAKDAKGNPISYMDRIVIDNDGSSLVYDATANNGNGDIVLMDAHGKKRTIKGTEKFSFGDGQAWLEYGTTKGAGKGTDGTQRRMLKVKTGEGNVVDVDLTRGPLGGKTVSLLNADFQATKPQKDQAGLVGDFFQAAFLGAATPEQLAAMNHTIRTESTYAVPVSRLGVLDKDMLNNVLPTR
jgi:hypothetical protein